MIYTIGHSASSPSSFLATLEKRGIGTVIDIRTHPASKWDHFNIEKMCDYEGWLATAGINYQWRSPLSGWQKRHADDETLVNRMDEIGVDLRTYKVGFHPKRVLRSRALGTGHLWDRRSEFDFSWYTVMPEFQVAALKLMAEVARGTVRKPVLLCSEYNWAGCHRAQIADFMSYHHGGVNHLVGDEVIPHDWHLLSRINKYDKNVIVAWGVKPDATS